MDIIKSNSETVKVTKSVVMRGLNEPIIKTARECLGSELFENTYAFFDEIASIINNHEYNLTIFMVRRCSALAWIFLGDDIFEHDDVTDSSFYYHKLSRKLKNKSPNEIKVLIVDECMIYGFGCNSFIKRLIDLNIRRCHIDTRVFAASYNVDEKFRDNRVDKMYTNEFHSEFVIRRYTQQYLKCIWEVMAPYHLSIAITKLIPPEGISYRKARCYFEKISIIKPSALMGSSNVEYTFLKDPDSDFYMRLYFHTENEAIYLLPCIDIKPTDTEFLSSEIESYDGIAKNEEMRLVSLIHVHRESIRVAESFAKKHNYTSKIIYRLPHHYNDKPDVNLKHPSLKKYIFTDNEPFDCIKERTYNDLYRNIFMAFNMISNAEANSKLEIIKLGKLDATYEYVEKTSKAISLNYFIDRVIYDTNSSKDVVWEAIIRLNDEGVISCKICLDVETNVLETCIVRGEGSCVANYESPLLKTFIGILKNVYNNLSSIDTEKLIKNVSKKCAVYYNPSLYNHYFRLIKNLFYTKSESTTNYYEDPKLTDDTPEAKYLCDVLYNCTDED